MQDELKASGISPEQSEMDSMLEELISLEDSSEDDRQNEDEEKKQKTEDDRAKAIDMRKKAMEKLSDTKKRKEEVKEGEPQKKCRRSSGDTIAYLREKK